MAQISEIKQSYRDLLNSGNDYFYLIEDGIISLVIEGWGDVRFLIVEQMIDSDENRQYVMKRYSKWKSAND